jgi:hypothetical protein
MPRNAARKGMVYDSDRKPYVRDASGSEMTDKQLLADAQRAAQVWRARVRSGKTEADRNQPLYTSGCGGHETAISHLPDDERLSIENELYGSSSDTE